MHSQNVGHLDTRGCFLNSMTVPFVSLKALSEDLSDGMFLFPRSPFRLFIFCQTLQGCFLSVEDELSFKVALCGLFVSVLVWGDGRVEFLQKAE